MLILRTRERVMLDVMIVVVLVKLYTNIAGVLLHFCVVLDVDIVGIHNVVLSGLLPCRKCKISGDSYLL